MYLFRVIKGSVPIIMLMIIMSINCVANATQNQVEVNIWHCQQLSEKKPVAFSALIQEKSKQPYSLLSLMNRCFVDSKADQLSILSGQAYLTKVLLLVLDKKGMVVGRKYIPGPIKMNSINGRIKMRKNKPFTSVVVDLGTKKTHYIGILLKGQVAVGFVNFINNKLFKKHHVIDQLKIIYSYLED